MLGSLIGAGTSIIGGLFGASSKAKAAKKEYERQKEFAQYGIRWKAKDAEKAGISKLYALGANTTSYAPQSVGGGTDYGIAQAGQNIARAVDATKSQPERIMAQRLANTQLEGLQLDNDIKRAELASKIARGTQAGTPPPYPGRAVPGSAGNNPNDTVPHIPGQGSAAGTVAKYETRIAPSGNRPEVSYGVRPEVDFYRTREGGYIPEIPTDLGEAHESQPLAAAAWFLRNRLEPWFDRSKMGVPFKAPAGKYWVFDPVWGYQLKNRPRNPPPARYRGTWPRG